MNPSTLKAKIQQDMSEALRSKNAERLGTMRLLWAAIRQREIDDRIELDDIEVLAVIDKMIKQRKDSIEQFRAGNRLELAEREEAEIKILQSYLPQPLSEEEIKSLIKDAIEETNASSVRDMGKVMAILKPKIQGKCDVSKVNAQIREALTVP